MSGYGNGQPGSGITAADLGQWGGESRGRQNGKRQAPSDKDYTDRSGGGLILSILMVLTGLALKAIKVVLNKSGMSGLAARVGVLSQKTDPVFVENWVRNLYKDSDNFQLNFNRINEYREYLLPKNKFPGAWIPVPENLERGFLLYGKLMDGKTEKTFLFSALHMNPSLLASAYRATAEQAIASGIFMCLCMSGFLYWLLGDLVGLTMTQQENWGALGSTSFFSFSNFLVTAPVSLVAIALIASPFLLALRIMRAEHDVLAFNEAMCDIERQIKYYGGDEAAREEVSVSNIEIADYQKFSEIRAEQLNNFWRVVKSGQPLIKSMVDDGTARERGMPHGLEAGTQTYIALEEKCMNTCATGMIGSGKTTKHAIPDFENTLIALNEKGCETMGLGLDGKAEIHESFTKILERNGFDKSRFVKIGVKDGEFGCNLFEGISTETIMGILPGTQPAIKRDFWSLEALAHIQDAVNVAKAYDLTPMGVQYEIDNGGATANSPQFVKRLCVDAEYLYKIIQELLDYFKENERARAALYTTTLKNSIEECLVVWRGHLKAEEMVKGIIAVINKYLSPFTKIGSICDRFGSGKRNGANKDPALMLNGYFFFVTLDTSEFPDAARVIMTFIRSRLYHELKMRSIRYKVLGKKPQAEPVIVIVDEHHLLASNGEEGISDVSFFNVSRSMGLCFTAMTQSTDAYVNALGVLETENMTQNFVSRIMLPNTSVKDQEYMAKEFGTYTRMNVANGVFPTEGSRELKNGGVITKPRTEIRKTTYLSPMGMPQNISTISDELTDELEKGVPLLRLPFSMSSRTVVPGHAYMSLINAPKTMESHRNSRIRYTTLSLFGGHDARSVMSLIDGEPATAPTPGKDELELEAKARFDGITEVPLFTNDDFIHAGSSYAIARIPQYGLQYSLRAKLDGIYI